MYAKVEPIAENNSTLEHEEYQVTNTRVSEYLRKYGQGKIDVMPQDSRPEVNDDREVNEMLDEDFTPGLGTDELDVMAKMDAMKERFENAVADIKATEKQKAEFDEAVKVLKDPNSSSDSRYHAMSILEDLENKGKIKRART